MGEVCDEVPATRSAPASLDVSPLLYLPAIASINHKPVIPPRDGAPVNCTAYRSPDRPLCPRNGRTESLDIIWQGAAL